jgi:hypothetical protein
VDGARGIVGVSVEFDWPGATDVVAVSESSDPVAVLFEPLDISVGAVAVLFEPLDISVGAVALPLEPLEFSDEEGFLEFPGVID